MGSIQQSQLSQNETGTVISNLLQKKFNFSVIFWRTWNNAFQQEGITGLIIFMSNDFMEIFQELLVTRSGFIKIDH